MPLTGSIIQASHVPMAVHAAWHEPIESKPKLVAAVEVPICIQKGRLLHVSSVQ